MNYVVYKGGKFQPFTPPWMMSCDRRRRQISLPAGTSIYREQVSTRLFSILALSYRTKNVLDFALTQVTICVDTLKQDDPKNCLDLLSPNEIPRKN